MLIMGGQEAARQRISRTIGRRGLIRMESIYSVDSGLSVLEWRNYDLVGTFLAAGLGTRLQESFVLRDAKVQLVLFGMGLSEEVASIRLRLRAQGLPSPILVRTDFDSYDESLFWRSLTSHMILPSVLEGTGPLPAVGDACDHAGPSP
ncbi:MULTISPECIES: hypothetical protein [Stenotrophomonas]|jgi:hypothetical protein|uniref:Uncharacterized protein n=5 Tax=Lysobacteraceae TaxID=32033 RepID=A0ABT8QDQ9_9GAMM|nr:MULTISPECIES: hypothetical protein [Stenotrophomonas]MDN8670026.1 hypothetical protein [Stenotrophomonas indicatrix]